MLRLVLCLTLASLFIALPALALQDFRVLKVEKDIRGDELWSVGFLYLADLGDAYLVQGDDNAVSRLTSAGIDFMQVTTVSRGEAVYLLRSKGIESDILFSKMLFDVGDGLHVAKLRIERPEDPRAMRLEKARLIPRPFPEPANTPLLTAPLAVTPKPVVQAIVDAVDGDSLFKTISEMSGNEPVVIGGSLDTLRTRFTESPKCDAAATYLVERFADYGYEAEIQEFWFSWTDLHYGDFVDADHGWVGGSRYVFRTQDGGDTWEVRAPGTIDDFLLDMCFLDVSRGWAVGTESCILRTDDGGDNWTRQYPPAGADVLHTVAFHDSMAGWVAGDLGRIIRTTDGGTSWDSVASGTSYDLYRLHFRSGTRGWACGQYGAILTWDGMAWSVRTGGTTESLFDIYFIDDDLGWIVGAGRTALKTTDGGLTWTPATIPVEASPYLYSVWFVSADEGWIAGNAGTILHTSDGGSTWELVDAGTLYYITYLEFVSASRGYAAGHGTTILKTEDGGTSWQSQSENLPEGVVHYAKNVVATLPGTVGDQRVIMCGHYDSATHTDPMNLAPGADDNASGTSAVLEAAKLMRGNSYERTVEFICFGGEEQGMRGSHVYAANARQAGMDIAGVVNLDMIAYSDGRPEPADLVCNPESEWLVDFSMECADVYVPTAPTRKVVSATITGSDHSPFWDAGYSAMFGHEDIPQVTPYVHTDGDTLGTLAKWFCQKFAKIAVATVAELAIPDTTTSGVTASAISTPGVRAYPNPTSSSTTFSLALAAAGGVSVDIFDVDGRWMRTLNGGRLSAGRHDLVWDGEDARGVRVSAGIYFARVRTGKSEAAAKVVLLD